MNNNFKNEVPNKQILQEFEEVKKLTEKMIKEENNLNSNQRNYFGYLPISKIHENYNYEKGTYKVRESWIEPDKNSGILKNGVYLKSPTAKCIRAFQTIFNNQYSYRNCF
jgi:hypothetical protein